MITCLNLALNIAASETLPKNCKKDGSILIHRLDPVKHKRIQQGHLSPELTHNEPQSDTDWFCRQIIIFETLGIFETCVFSSFGVHTRLCYFTVADATRFYSSRGDLLDRKGLKTISFTPFGFITDFSILLWLMPDDFTRQKETSWT